MLVIVIDIDRLRAQHHASRHDLSPTPAMPSSPSTAPDKAETSLIQPAIPTPHWGQQTGSAFTVRATVAINATPDAILHTLLNTADYPRWNNFVPRVTLSTPGDENSKRQLAAGVDFTEHVDMFGNGRPSGLIKMQLLMTTLQDHHHSQPSPEEERTPDENAGARPPRERYTVVWLGRALPDWALRSERVHVIGVMDEDGSATYDVYETFSGALAGVTKLFVGKALVKRFGQWNDELKGYVERRQ